jgi:hypothetical protein
MAAPVPSPDSSSSLRHTLVAAIAKGFPDLKQFVQPTPKAGWPQQLPAMGLPAMGSKPKAGWPQQLPSGLAGHQDPGWYYTEDDDDVADDQSVIDTEIADDQSEDADATVTVPLPIPLHEYLKQLLPSDMPESTESDKVLILVKAKISTGGPRGPWGACSMSSSESAPLLENVLDRVRYRGPRSSSADNRGPRSRSADSRHRAADDRGSRSHWRPYVDDKGKGRKGSGKDWSIPWESSKGKGSNWK